jgi:hypothetical protein
VSPSSRIDLASGMVNHDRLLVQLIEPADSPALVAVSWPSAATVSAPADYPATAAAIVCVISESATALARRKAHGK